MLLYRYIFTVPQGGRPKLAVVLLIPKTWSPEIQIIVIRVVRTSPDTGSCMYISD